MNIKQRGIS